MFGGVVHLYEFICAGCRKSALLLTFSLPALYTYHNIKNPARTPQKGGNAVSDENRSPGKDPASELPPGEEQSRADPGKKLRISHTFAVVCMLIVAFAAGAAIMADRFSAKENQTRIVTPYPDSSAAVTSAKAAVSSTASAQKITTVPISSVSDTDTAPKTETAVTAAAAFSFPADINLVGADCLAYVNGINRSVAEAVIDYRDKHTKIRDLDELLDVYGIGERTLSVIKEHFYVDPADYSPRRTASVPVTQPPVQTTGKQSRTKPQVTETETSPTETVSPTATAGPEPVPEPRAVNINSASAEELADALLIDIELAGKIVELRDNIGRFVSPRELLYVEGFSDAMYLELKELLLISDKTEESEVTNDAA